MSAASGSAGVPAACGESSAAMDCECRPVRRGTPSAAGAAGPRQQGDAWQGMPMLVWRGCDEVPQGLAPTSITIGAFDGVHRGHRVLLERAIQEAGDALMPVAVTFDPHPMAIIRPDLAPLLLTSMAHRLELFEGLGMAGTLVIQFTAELAAESAERFATRVLAETLNARHVVVGGNFRFGHRAAGDVVTLTELGRELGFDVSVVELEPLGEALDPPRRRGAAGLGGVLDRDPGDARRRGRGRGGARAGAPAPGQRPGRRGRSPGPSPGLPDGEPRRAGRHGRAGRRGVRGAVPDRRGRCDLAGGGRVRGNQPDLRRGDPAGRGVRAGCPRGLRRLRARRRRGVRRAHPRPGAVRLSRGAGGADGQGRRSRAGAGRRG